MAFIDDYVAWALGQQPNGIDLDHAYGPQCVDLADDYAIKMGHPFPGVEGAKDFAGRSIPGWTWVVNSPEAIPPPGAIVIWGSGIGFYGHVAVRNGRPADLNYFQSVDQNWVNSSQYGSPPSLVTHNYVAVAGWFVPDAAPAGGVAQMPTVPAFQTRQFHGRAFKATAWYATPGDLNSKTADVAAGAEANFDARADSDTLWIRGMNGAASGAWWTPDQDWDTDTYGGTPVALVNEPKPTPPPVAPVVPPPDPEPNPTTPGPTLAEIKHQLDVIQSGIAVLLAGRQSGPLA